MDEKLVFQCKQDLHIHSVYSSGDIAVVKEQTIDLIARIRHADIIGISDHFEYIRKSGYVSYADEVKAHDFKLGTEVDGYQWIDDAMDYEFDYYIYHCRDNRKDYKGAEQLLLKGKPVIIAHPCAMGTDLNKVPADCVVEINNRYVYRYDWKAYYSAMIKKFRFVLSSDAHQPNWLNLNISRYVANELGIKETILFE